MDKMFNGNKELEIYLLKKERNLLEEKKDLIELKEEKRDELIEIDNKIMLIENEIQTYKSYKKQLIKRSLVNILQIISVVSLLALPVNLLNLKLILIASNKIKLFNLGLLFMGLFGNGIVLAFLGFELKDYKNINNKDYFNGKEINDLENSKEYLLNYINKLDNNLKQNENNLNKLHNTFRKRKINYKYNNTYEQENDIIKKKSLKNTNNML